MASLIAGLTEKMQALSDREEDPAEKSLAEIRDLMTTLNTNVKTVSDTLSRLSEEV